MSQPHEYDFFERLGMSHGIAVGTNIGKILLSKIPGAVSVRKAASSDDRNGTDWWVDRDCGRPLSVDVKVREKDFGMDDLALETWSVVETGKIGWTRDVRKKTDYILWLWRDTQLWRLLPFPMLCKVFQDNWLWWSCRYRCETQKTPGINGGWHSECVFVPRRVVWAAIYNTFAGRLAA